MPRCLELCCGENSSWSQAAKELGYETTRVDCDEKVCPDIWCDVRDLEVPEGFYDVICASPDCRDFRKTGDVLKACVRLCKKAKCLGVLESSRERKDLQATKVDYCMYSGSGDKQLYDWFPSRKRTNIYTWSFGPTLNWLPSRPLCSRVDHCDWLIDKKCGVQHSTKYECHLHCLPRFLSTAQEHSIPRRLCLEILAGAAGREGIRSNLEGNMGSHAGLHRV